MLEMRSEAVLPLVLTLKLDQKTLAVLNQLRQQHFPPERNFLPAHITLFHALPGEHQTAVQQRLQQVCSVTSPFELALPNVRSLGKGVAVEVSSPALLDLRQALARCWSQWLTRQDQQRFRPHVTIQNKVTAEVAHQLYERLSREWRSLEGTGEGLLLWNYKGGPWELATEFPFEG